MPDEWACDECGYIASSEPDAGKCPGCGAKMTKIESDDSTNDDPNYDDDDLATPIDEDDWDELAVEAKPEPEIMTDDEEEEPEDRKKAA